MLYEGTATKIRDNSTNETLFFLTTRDITFILAQKGQFLICQYILIRTEHPKVFIREIKYANSVLHHNNPLIYNMDMFTYVNSKFIYSEMHIQMKVKRFYRDLLHHRCSLERKVFRNALKLATHAPDEFASNLTESICQSL